MMMMTLQNKKLRKRRQNQNPQEEEIRKKLKHQQNRILVYPLLLQPISAWIDFVKSFLVPFVWRFVLSPVPLLVDTVSVESVCDLLLINTGRNALSADILSAMGNLALSMQSFGIQFNYYFLKMLKQERQLELQIVEKLSIKVQQELLVILIFQEAE